MRRRIFITVFALGAALFFACSSQAVPPVNVTEEGVAIKGYDPVAYFTRGEPAEGSAEFEYEWQGARWRFTSAEHMEIFKAEPEKYAPQYGGYCAYAVSRGTTADIDPYAWTIVNGKLYLNLNKGVRRVWEKDIPGNIRKADENWPAVLEK